MIEALPNPKYLTRLLSVISGAKKEIILVQFLVELEERGPDPAGKITRALIGAKGGDSVGDRQAFF